MEQQFNVNGVNQRQSLMGLCAAEEQELTTLSPSTFPENKCKKYTFMEIMEIGPLWSQGVIHVSTYNIASLLALS